MDLRGAVVLGAVERDQQVRTKPLEGLDPAGALERRNRLPEGRKQVIGRDRIERVADVIVGRDAGDPEQGLAVRAAVAGLELALMIQEGGALREEHRKGGAADIGHGVSAVAAPAPVRELLTAAPHAAEQAVEHLHAKVESDSTARK